MRRGASILLVTVVVLLAWPRSAQAVYYGPSFQPPEAPPGATVTMGGTPPAGGFPNTGACPTVKVFLVPATVTVQITSVTDSRLIPLAGRTTVVASTPVFTFVVPDLPPGGYQPYFLCPGGTSPWNSLQPNQIMFTILPLPSGATPPPTSSAEADRPADRREDMIALFGLLGLLSLSGILVLFGRSSGRLGHRG